MNKSMENFFEQFIPRELSEKEKEIQESLRSIEGAEVTAGIREVYSYILRFVETDAMISVYLTFFDEESGADLAITNMTNLPRSSDKKLDEVRGRGQGSQVIQKVIAWAEHNGYGSIVATQVQEAAKEFWRKNGFVYDERENNISEDWRYRSQKK